MEILIILLAALGLIFVGLMIVVLVQGYELNKKSCEEMESRWP